MKNRSASPTLRHLLAAGSLASGLMAAPHAGAQMAGDAPWRVGRVAQIIGQVSMHGAGATDWTPAQLNFPVTSGDALWTQPGGQSAVQVAGNAVVMAGSTEFDLATLDNRQLVATEPQGELFLGLRSVPGGDSYTITTPRGTVQIATAGQYVVLAGDTQTPTAVSVVSGAARIVSGGFSLNVGAGQTATITGTDTVQGAVGPLVHDPFLSAILSRPASAQPAPSAVQQMTGYESLGDYGNWQAQPDYGQVWFPRVDPGWVPYREGSWAYVAPWGWTWIDNEPWGFTPFHYGRWAQMDGRWGWIPAPPQPQATLVEEPAYAPALVAFLVAGAVTAGEHRDDRIGWVPLGPGEAYHPDFTTSRAYLDRLDRGGADRGDHGRRPDGAFANRGALTVIPAAAMARSEQVGHAAAAGPDHGHGGAFAAFQPVHGPLPVRPGPSTRGLTPASQHALGLVALPAHPASPGPAVDPRLFQPHALPNNRAPFRTASGTPVPNTAMPIGPQPGKMHPEAPGAAAAPPHPDTMPRLRAPGAPRPEVGGPMPVHPGEPGPRTPAGLPIPPRPAPGPDAFHGEPPRPPGGLRIQPMRPLATHAEPARPEMPRPGAARPEAPRPEAPRAQPPRPDAPRPERPRPEAPRPQPRMEAPHPQARPEPPRPAPVRPAPARPPAPHPGPHAPEPPHR